MSSTKTGTPGRAYVRRTIRQTIRTSDGQPDRDGVVETASAIADVRERVVGEEFDKLEEAGFLYIRDEGVVLA